MQIIIDSISEVGGRKVNQDYCHFEVIDQESACWVVADGLGGHHGGEVASRIAVDKILSSFRNNPKLSPLAIKQHLELAQNAIIQQQNNEPKLFSMRTTVVILISDFKSVLWAHVGDSRLYFFRDGDIVFQSKDHSVPQAMVAAGDIELSQIRYHEDRNRLLRVLGKEGDLRPDIRQEATSLKPGDVFLLCTDGYWEYVTELEMSVDLAMARNPKEWLKIMENRILERAQGEFDNYSAIAVFIDN